MKDDSNDYFRVTQKKLKEFNNYIDEKSRKQCQTELENFQKIKVEGEIKEKLEDINYNSSYNKALAELKECQYILNFEKTKYNNLHQLATKLFQTQTKLCIKDCGDKFLTDGDSYSKCATKCKEDTEKYTIKAYSDFIVPELQRNFNKFDFRQN